MQIASTAEVIAKQDMMHVTKRDATPTDYAIYVGQKGSAKNADDQTEQKQETYQPSKEGLSLLAQENQEKLMVAQTALEGLERQEEQGNPYEDYTRAMKIALNMMRGKRVPPQDEKFLMQFDDELYQAAKNVQMMKEIREDAESELEDEDEDIRQKIRKLALDDADSGQATESGVSTEAVASDTGGDFSASV